MGVSKTGKTTASRYKADVSVNQATNVGFDDTIRLIVSGDGAESALSLSDDAALIQPVNDNSVGTFEVKNNVAGRILRVDTTNSIINVGQSLVSATTLFKEMGLYDFSPNDAGYHYPLIANTMFIPTGATAFAYDNDWGNAADPAATLDVSGLTAQENAIAVYWYLEHAITLDSVRYMITADGSDSINLHLESYDLDVSSNHGDLSGGTTCASVSSISATATTVKTGTFTLDSADIAASKVVIGFVESDSTTDLSVALSIKYHIQ